MPSKHNPFQHLFSKLLAGGLSAGLVLAWWPAFFHSEGVMSWVWRGLAWTLMFELMLGALIPLEEAINRSSAYVSLKRLLARPFKRLRRFTPDSPLASAALLAVGALALPIGLMVSRSGEVKPEQPTKLVRVTKKKVVRPVKVVKVTKLVPVQSAALPSPSPSYSEAGTQGDSPKKSSPSPAEPEKKAPEKPEETQAPETPVSPSPVPPGN